MGKRCLFPIRHVITDRAEYVCDAALHPYYRRDRRRGRIKRWDQSTGRIPTCETILQVHRLGEFAAEAIGAARWSKP
jgi:hypothetical protein